MARVVPADKRLPDDGSEHLNIGLRASQPRAVTIHLCFAFLDCQQNVCHDFALRLRADMPLPGLGSTWRWRTKMRSVGGIGRRIVEHHVDR
jgi:hypothetical protein